MRDPWLSIVIPTHAGERWLAETLESLAVQDDPGLDCIVIDSSPTDGTAQIVRTFAHRLAIRFHRRPDLGPWGDKTNFGFAQALAPHVCMLHQDDFWLPGRAASVRKWIEACPHAAMHLHPSYIVDEHSRRLGTWRCPLPSDGRAAPRELMLERLLVQNFISIPSPVISRDAFLACGGIDGTLWYTGDWDLYLKLARRGEVVYHPQTLSCFRIHGQSLTISGSRNVEDFEAQLRRVLAAHIEAIPVPRRAAILRKAQASIAINTSLAAAGHGKRWQGLAAVLAMLLLGPVGLHGYLRDSRLVERLLPRIRTRLAYGHRVRKSA